jgi:predicted acylesterase/phospholipase RssA
MDVRDDYARVGRFASGRAVGVVLSGGGARGLAHIGVIRACSERGVPIDAIGGASMGAIVGALCASGLDADQVAAHLRDEYVDHHDYDYTLPIVALSSAAGSVRRMKRLFGDRGVEDLPIPYFCMSTNLSRAEPVVMERGPLWRAVRMSSSLPGLLPPIADRGDLFVDGGLLNNLPADVMRERGAGLVIGVDVTPGVDLRTSEEVEASISGWSALWRRVVSRQRAFPSIVDIMSRAALVGCIRDAARMRAACDVYVAPAVEAYAMGDFGAIDRLIAAGYESALTALEARADLPRRVLNT